MQIIISEQRLDQMANFINEMPTKYGFALAVLLNQWRTEALNAEQAEQPSNEPPPTEN